MLANFFLASALVITFASASPALLPRDTILPAGPVNEPLAGAVPPGRPDIPGPTTQGKFEHVVILSVDGMHQNDLVQFVADYPSSTFATLLKNAIEFTNATTSSPSDSFPGSAAYVTGGSPRTTGVYYDVSYAREYYPPGTNCTGPLGAASTFDETIDLNNTMLNGGGGFNISALMLRKASDGSCQPVLPHDYIRVNTIFEVVRNSGRITAYSDKHPAYEYVNGPSGLGLTQSYFPEVAAVAVTVPATESYDLLHWSALTNWTLGKQYNGTSWSKGTPALYGADFQAVSVAEKATGYTNNGTVFSANLTQAFQFTDQQLGSLVATMKTAGTYNKTLLIVTAKHGQSPQDVSLLKYVDPNALLNGTGVVVAGSSADDGAYLWLANSSDAATAKANLLKNATGLGIAKVYAGSEEVVAFGFGDPATDPRAPDVVVVTEVGVIYTPLDSTKVAEHGGVNPADVDVLLFAHNPSFTASKNSDSVSTRQIAATAVKAFGIEPCELQAVKIEGTEVLPGIF